MKYLRTRDDEVAGNSTAAVVRACLNEPPKGGLTLDDIRARTRVLEAVERADGAPVIAFEDADATTLQKCVKAKVWPVFHPAVVVFADAVADMPSTPPEAA